MGRRRRLLMERFVNHLRLAGGGNLRNASRTGGVHFNSLDSLRCVTIPPPGDLVICCKTYGGLNWWIPHFHSKEGNSSGRHPPMRTDTSSCATARNSAASHSRRTNASPAPQSFRQRIPLSTAAVRHVAMPNGIELSISPMRMSRFFPSVSKSTTCSLSIHTSTFAFVTRTRM